MSAGQSMAKVGRPKVAGLYREPNGRASRSKQSTAIYLQRERDTLRAMSRKSDLESPLGLMFRNERITAQMFAAGLRFASDRAQADAALGLPPRHCQAQNVNRVGGVSHAEDTPERIRAKRRDVSGFDNAEAAVGLNSAALRALQWVAIYEQRPIAYQEVIDLIEGLGKLVKHYAGRA